MAASLYEGAGRCCPRDGTGPPSSGSGGIGGAVVPIPRRRFLVPAEAAGRPDIESFISVDATIWRRAPSVSMSAGHDIRQGGPGTPTPILPGSGDARPAPIRPGGA